MKINVVLILLFLPLMMKGQLISGPMLGHVTYQEATVWVQCKESSHVQLSYWPADQIKTIKTTMPVVTASDHAHTAHLVAGELMPGTTYQYEIWVNGKKLKANNEQTFKTPAVWKYRGNAPDFDFVAGSCFYINEEAFDRPGKPYGGDYKILQSIHKDRPDFMVWLGDNTYLRDADWDSRTGVYHRYSHTRAVPELQPLISQYTPIMPSGMITTTDPTIQTDPTMERNGPGQPFRISGPIRCTVPVTRRA
jgi:alkaline phosphatase D